MLSPPHIAPTPVGFPLPGGARPFLPAPPLLPPIFGPPQNFPCPPPFPPPVMPPLISQNFVPPSFSQSPPYGIGGPESWLTRTPQFHSHQSSRWSHQKKKQKPSHVAGASPRSRPGPKPVLFVCAPCHKEYKSQETYNTHLATHVKCSHCDFECSKGGMHEHELVHYLPAELNFNSPEDIEKWRAERRKNFPTAETVLRKQQLQEKKAIRGDVADTPLYRYVSRICGSDGGCSQRRGKNNRWVVGTNRKYPRQGQCRGGGVAGGGGRGEEDRGSPRQCWKRGQRGRGRRGTWRGKNSWKKEAGGCDGHGLKYVTARKPTLLEKLLANEIRQEQNTLLQCIRYILRTELLGVGGVGEGMRAGNGEREQQTEKGEVANSGEEVPLSTPQDAAIPLPDRSNGHSHH